MFSSPKYNRGFTLIELLVVIAIIVILLGIVIASISQARQSTREKKRVADLGNIEFALTLYKEKNRDYPSYPSGVEIGVTTAAPNIAINDIVKQYNGSNKYADPITDAAGSGYGYFYDSSFTCTKSGEHVIYAMQTELSKNANFASLCTAASASEKTTYALTYIVVLK